MKLLFRRHPAPAKISVSMTINGGMSPSSWCWRFHRTPARSRCVEPIAPALSGTIQNDILKEFIGPQHLYLLRPNPSMRLDGRYHRVSTADHIRMFRLDLRLRVLTQVLGEAVRVTSCQWSSPSPSRTGREYASAPPSARAMLISTVFAPAPVRFLLLDRDELLMGSREASWRCAASVAPQSCRNSSRRTPSRRCFFFLRTHCRDEAE